METDGMEGGFVTVGEELIPREDAQRELKRVTQDVLAILSSVDDDSGQRLLSSFVSDLFLSVAKERQREERHRKQAAGIAAAKQKGVRFGAAMRTLPDNFEEVHQAWRKDQLTLKQAAAACEMPISSFYAAAVRKGGPKGSPSRLMDRETG